MGANRLAVGAALVAVVVVVAACSGSQSSSRSEASGYQVGRTDTELAVPSGDFLGQKLDVVLGMTSMECYSFDSLGGVELRHNGLADPSDYGTFEGDDASGIVAWASGRSSSVVMSGGRLTVDGLSLTPVSSCA
jgi:hypothetical protein